MPGIARVNHTENSLRGLGGFQRLCSMIAGVSVAHKLLEFCSAASQHCVASSLCSGEVLFKSKAMSNILKRLLQI